MTATERAPPSRVASILPAGLRPPLLRGRFPFGRSAPVCVKFCYAEPSPFALAPTTWLQNTARLRPAAPSTGASRTTPAFSSTTSPPTPLGSAKPANSAFRPSTASPLSPSAAIFAPTPPPVASSPRRPPSPFFSTAPSSSLCATSNPARGKSVYRSPLPHPPPASRSPSALAAPVSPTPSLGSVASPVSPR